MDTSRRFPVPVHPFVRACLLALLVATALPSLCLAGWTTPPPSSAVAGATVNVAFNMTTSSTNPAFIALWVQSPNGTWTKAWLGGGSPNTNYSGSYQIAVTTLGTWNWRGTGETSSSTTVPSSDIKMTATMTVVADTTAPSIPGGLAANSITSSSFTATWNASTDNVGVTAYEVSRDGNSLGTVGGLSKSITGLSQATTYAVRVRARDQAGNWSNWSSPLNVTTLDSSAPSIPSGLYAANITGTSFTLNWTASTDNVGVTAYEVMRNTSSLGTVSGTSKSVTGLSQSTTYAMKVRARDAAGNWSDWSGVLNVVTTDSSAPSVPTGLSASVITGTGFVLSWAPSSDNVGVSAYEVMRDTSSQGTVGTTSANVSGLTPATAYSMKVRALDGEGNLSGWSTPLTVTTSQSSGQSALVGTLPGDLSVDNKGAANYSIPLLMPPGRSGIQPSVALAYSSGGGNGVAGVGWSVSHGFPQSITRGRTILARDTFLDAPDYDANDKFYLDGKRLICISGTEGNAGSTYRTEVDSFVTIQAQGSGTNIDRFVATDKSGTKMTFGRLGGAEDAYHQGGGENEGKAYAYALKRVEDTVGNYCEFTYQSFGDGEYALSAIAYTGSPSGAPEQRVDFVYATSMRGDKSRTYTGRRWFQNTVRLDAITASSKLNGQMTVVTRYTLGYETAPHQGRTRLITVSPEFLSADGSGFQTVPSTTIGWSNESLTWGAVTDPPLPDSPTSQDGWSYSFADFNNDGKEDYLDADGSLRVFLSNSGSFSSTPSWTYAAAPIYAKAILGDFDGDGRKDVLYGIGESFSNLYVVRSTGSGFTGLSGGTPTLVTNTAQIFKDPNINNQTSYELASRERIAIASRIVVADFTGDGRDDVMLHDYTGYFHLYASTGTGFQFVKKSTYATAGFTTIPAFDWGGYYSAATVPPNYSLQPMPCDLNGDGRTDYAAVVTIRGGVPGSSYTCNRYLQYSVAKADGDFSQPTQLHNQYVGGGGSGFVDPAGILYWVTPTDVNGDGLTDFLSFGNGFAGGNRWMLYLNKGGNATTDVPQFEAISGAIPNTVALPGGGSAALTYFETVASWGSYSFAQPWLDHGDSYNRLYSNVECSGGTGMYLLELNGDGFPDFVWYRGARWWVMFGTGGVPDANGRYFNNPQELTGAPWSTTTCTQVDGYNPSFTATNLAQVDVNGDGRMDWTSHFTMRGETKYMKGIASNAGPHPDLVTTISNGLGSSTSIDYLAAKHDSLYTPGASVAFPIREVRGSNPVVSDVTKDSGGTATAHFSYQYSGNRLDLSGRGPLGFHSFVTLDRQTNLFKYQFLVQSFPMTGLTHREQTYRYWTSSGNTNFRIISSHDNTVVFDEVVSSGGTAYGTVYPFMSQAVESRWEDSTTRHYPASSQGEWSATSSPNSKAELLFTSYKTHPPGGAHITITAQSWFDNQSQSSGPQTTAPAVWHASDTNSSGQNVVVGVTNFPTYLTATHMPRKITHGNLTQLKTDFGGGFTETVTTTYLGVTSNGIASRVDKVRTSVTSPDYGTEHAPDKRFKYWSNGTTPTPLPQYERIDANRDDDAADASLGSGDELDVRTTYARDSLGRVTSTTVTGHSAPGPEGADVIGSLTDANIQHVGSFVSSYITNYDPKWDLPTSADNAQGYQHTTTTAYHSFLGKPTTVTDTENNATTTTEYDALGRPLKVTNHLGLAQRTQFAWTTSGASDWKKTRTVAPPSGHTGVASGAPITGVVGVSVSSVYATRQWETAGPSDDPYKPEIWTYYDRLGRVIKTIKIGFGEQRVHTDTAYNNLGQVIATSLPYPEGGTVYWTKTAYDALGRVVTVTAPNDTVTTNSYHGRATKVTVDAPNLGGVNPAPQTNVTLVDFKGRTVRVWNADNVPSISGPILDESGISQTASIEYVLDGFGRMRATVLKDQTQQITATYDAHGRQTSLNDPDKGNWSYVNNPLGHVVKQTDAKGSITRTVFDRLGRQLKRETREPSSGPVELARWFYYDNAANTALHLVVRGAQGWVGSPQRDTLTVTGAPGYPASEVTNVQYYNAKGLIAIALSTIDGKWFYTHTDYDPTTWLVSGVRHYWRPPAHEAPSDLPYVWNEYGYLYTYDGRSYLTNLEDTADRTWWSNPTYDHLDRVTQVKKGAGHWTRRTYRPEDGVATAILTGPTTSSTAIQNLGFNFDGLGNLTSRGNGSLSETFGYDNLNRLTARNGSTIASYAANGNITSKVDVSGTSSGTYAYTATVALPGGGTRALPHAVSSAWGYTMTYDANGNLTGRTKSGETWATKWPGFDRPRWIARDTSGSDFTNGTFGSEFHYNANRSRVLHLEFDSMTSGAAAPLHYTRKKIYAYGATMEVDYRNEITSGSGQTWKMDKVRIYVPGPEGNLGTMEFAPFQPFSQAERALVYHYDHLASIESITRWGDTTSTVAIDEIGQPSRFSYDPWGERRDPTDWSGKPATTDNGGPDGLSSSGFTGHEMLDDLGLVHMNGRIYDPLLGRFLSADKFVPNIWSAQSFNRYSYVENRPLSLVDPSGFDPTAIAAAQAGRPLVAWQPPATPLPPRVAAGIGLVGSSVEIVGGIAAALTPEPTMGSKAIAAVAIPHGIDGFQANARTLWTGEPVDTFTHQGIQAGAEALGASPGTANTIATVGDAALGMVDIGVSAPSLIRTLASSGDDLAEAATRAASNAADNAGGATPNPARVTGEAPTTPAPAESGTLPSVQSPPLASVLEGHGAGQGFSTVYDASTGELKMLPSTADRAAPVPEGWVSRAGGHADVSAALGGDVAKHHGLAVVLQEDGTLAVTWRSGTLNNTPDGLVPEAMRAEIVRKIEEQTGRTVSSF